MAVTSLALFPMIPFIPVTLVLAIPVSPVLFFYLGVL